jgi:micrococcal nuclease
VAAGRCHNVDRFGRALRYVINADGDDVGGLLVEQGAAIARSYPPDTANDDRYALLQEAARRDGRGLWAADACGDALVPVGGMPVAVDIDLHPDAAGDDNVNLNDEWVRFTNAGTAPIDLSGWTVRDERYWCNVASAVWNNGGDTAFLLDPAGNVVASRSY